MNYSIVVPCYNEEKNIPLILERFSKVISHDGIEVILVNNGSEDFSQDIIDRLLPQYPFARCVKVKVNQGYGFGILSGLHAAKGLYLGWTHADMQTDPKDVITAFSVLQDATTPALTFVKGARRGRPLFDRFFTVGMSIMGTFYLKTRLWDINAQPNVFHRDFFKRWHMPPHDFSLDLYVYFMARKLGLKVKRFEVQFPKRQFGQSSWNTGLASKWKFIKRTLAFSIALKKGNLS